MLLIGQHRDLEKSMLYSKVKAMVGLHRIFRNLSVIKVKDQW